MLRWLKNLLTKDKKESAKNGLSSSFVVDKQSTSEIDKIITVDNDQDALHTLGSVTSGRYFPECQNQTNRSCGDEHKRIEGNNVYRKSTEFSVKECGTKVSDRSIVNQNDSRTFAKETSLFQLSSQQLKTSD
ncbi:hypothetical protein SK128_000919 [Halocaridina rubra]|uniref:Uncharacterized protein n=1 Tax=Halocaridina rubra TaxID=373956 RepID=A0AAN9A967_HALRR